jgi:hypothetical protein
VWVFLARSYKQIYRQEHGHRRYEGRRVAKDVDIGLLVRLIENVDK